VRALLRSGLKKPTSKQWKPSTGEDARHSTGVELILCSQWL
jgi:hypothetical protein